MNKKILWISFAYFFAIVVIPFFSIKMNLNSNQKLTNFIEKNAYAVSSSSPSGLPSPPPANADLCFETYNAVVNAQPSTGTWENGVLDHMHGEAYRLNNMQTAQIELIFCRLSSGSIMDVQPNLSDLPQTITKTDPTTGLKVTVTITSPTESFATSAGYKAKAVFTVNGTYENSAYTFDDVTFMTVWWAGSGSASKGYLIQGQNPMQMDGNTRLGYVLWDLTGTTQVVKFLGTQYLYSYLGSASALTTSGLGGDNAIYGNLSYNTSTQEITMQDIEIRQNPSSTSFGCIRTYFTGTWGGTITGYRPGTSISGSPTAELLTETATGSVSTTSPAGVGLIGEAGIVDALTTPNGSIAASALPAGTFDHSCADMAHAATATYTFNPFSGGTVNYDSTPSEIF